MDTRERFETSPEEVARELEDLGFEDVYFEYDVADNPGHEYFSIERVGFVEGYVYGTDSLPDGSDELKDKIESESFSLNEVEDGDIFWERVEMVVSSREVDDSKVENKIGLIFDLSIRVYIDRPFE